MISKFKSIGLHMNSISMESIIDKNKILLFINIKMNPLNILMAQSDRFFKNNQKDPAPPAALLSFSFMSSIQIVPG